MTETVQDERKQLLQRLHRIQGQIASLEQPVAFGNTSYMFTMRSDVLYAKIRRGGMGTDMPNFGTLFTPEETWALVDYLWQLALEDN